MKNKGFIIFLTVIVSLLCIYYLSFTLISNGVKDKAAAYALNEDGNVDYGKKQHYLDSVYTETVYTLFGTDYTYKEITDTELSLGLDLQGGMHVTLEVSPKDIIRALANNNDNPEFIQALNMAIEMQRNSQDNFIDLFAKSYSDIAPEGKLSRIFGTASNKGRVDANSSNDEVYKFLNLEIEEAIGRSEKILRTRVDRFGTTQPNIQRLQGTGKIQIELPGANNPKRVHKLLQAAAKLEFWEVIAPKEYAEPFNQMAKLLVDEAKAESIKDIINTDEIDSIDLAENVTVISDADTSELSAEDKVLAELASSEVAADSSLVDEQVGLSTPLAKLMQSYNGFYVLVKDTAEINNMLDRTDVKALFPRNLRFIWTVKASPITRDGTGVEYLELMAIDAGVKGKAPLEGNVITNAVQDYDQNARPAVTMQMTTIGAKKWKKLTGDNVGQNIAVVLDGYVYTAPTVNGEIAGGRSEITGNFTVEEAKDLASILKAGKLPAPTRIVEEAIVGPTLGRAAQRQGIISIVSGLGIVILFMFFYYSKGGLVANLALVFNVFFILGILANLSTALTLPGIAGIVLTIGMSIDANVLIFERIREELRNGMGLMNAISRGYDKAFSSIIDSNVTTFLVGLILYVFGQGPVKGFAATLMIGIVSSFFSAVFITRVIVEWMSKRGDESKISFSTPFTNNLFKNLKIDFLIRRKKAYIFSAIIIVIGMGLIVSQKGLNFGVDFTGGRSYVVDFGAKTPVASDAKVALVDDFENAGIEVKTYGSDNVLKITTSYLVNDESDSADAKVEAALVAGLEEFSGSKFIKGDIEDLAGNDKEGVFIIAGFSKVGATIADDIRWDSIKSMLFALVVIAFYILIRFRKWQYSLGAILALFHDTLVVLSAFAIARAFGISYEVDQVFIAAILTIIGYSINDTVVLFDRVRETMQVRSQAGLIENINIAINSTISRTLITSITTLIVVLVLFLFGGEILRGFSFALLIGIVVGTYSSIFIATPSVLDFQSKKNKK